MRQILTATLLGLVRGYQLFVSPLLGPRCRFAPSCSHYAAEAIGTHGPLRGLILAGRRLLRCHPWGGSGYDPVPARDCACSGAPTRQTPDLGLPV
jgi:putative membrane protein insertion efficiency factor